jgi:hypothetical protein
MSPRFASFGWLKEIRTEYSQRVVLPKTPIEFSAYLDDDASSQYRGNFKDLAGFLDKLKEAEDKASEDELSKSIVNNSFSKSLQTSIGSFDDKKPISASLKQELIAQLDALVKGPSLYKEDLFNGITLPADVVTLQTQAPKGLELADLNWLLLASAYPDCIAAPTLVSKPLPGQPSSDSDILNPTERADGLKRLPLVAFPEFFSATFTKGNLSAIVPSQAANLAFGVAGSNAQSVTVKIPAAESVGLSISAIADALMKSGNPVVTPETITDGEEQKAIKPFLNKQLAGSDGTYKKAFSETWLRLKDPYRNALKMTVPTSTDVVWARVITEVYYARVIDISIQSSKSRGANINVNNPQGAEDEEAADNATQKDVAQQAVDTANRLNAKLKAIGGLTVPGGQIQFVTASNQGVSMRRVWEHPVAVGFRGFVVEIHKDTGIILDAMPTFSSLPLSQKIPGMPGMSGGEEQVENQNQGQNQNQQPASKPQG